MAEALQLRPDDELLELGCGSAGFLAGFADVTIQNVPWGTLNPINRIFAKVVGPICGDLRLVSGIKPEQRA